MKAILTPQREHGTVLVTTLVMAMLIAVVIAALLFVAQQHNQMTARARVWSSEIPLAEAGVEEAMALLNSRPSTLVTEGWQTVNTTNVWKRREFTNAYFHTTIIPSSPSMSAATNTIISIGAARVPLRTNYTRRTVMAIAKLGPPTFGIVAKKTFGITFSDTGNPYVDSYDSSDPRYSTNGLYDPNKRRDRAGVATLSTNAGAISTAGNGKIYGYAATGPRGTVAGNVGDGYWLSGGGTGVQPGHATDDFNAAIPDVALPSPWTPNTIVLPGVINGVTYNYAITNAGDYQFNTGVRGSLYVAGKTRIYFKQDFKMSGGTGITLAHGASVEIYMGGELDMAGSTLINPSGLPANLAIYGLPTCTAMKLGGGAEIHAKLYAPQADIRLQGNFDFFGSIVGNTIQASGNAAIHYDEALGGNKNPDYRIVSWEEL